MNIPPNVVSAAQTISLFLKENNTDKVELGDLSISLRNDVPSIDEIQAQWVEKIQRCSAEISKCTYDEYFARAMYDNRMKMTFDPDYSTDGQFTGGFRTECYTAHYSRDRLVFFDLEEDCVLSVTEFDREKWLEWRKKDKFILQLCS